MAKRVDLPLERCPTTSPHLSTAATYLSYSFSGSGRALRISPFLRVHFEKCQALKDLEKGESSKDVAGKYNVPKNTLSTWVKNKEQLFDALKKGTNVKRQTLKSGNHELVGQAIFNWFLNMRSQNVPLSVSMIQEKAVIIAKELSTENFSGFRCLATTLEGKK